MSRILGAAGAALILIVGATALVAAIFALGGAGLALVVCYTDPVAAFETIQRLAENPFLFVHDWVRAADRIAWPFGAPAPIASSYGFCVQSTLLPGAAAASALGLLMFAASPLCVAFGLVAKLIVSAIAPDAAARDRALRLAISKKEIAASRNSDSTRRARIDSAGEDIF